MEGPHKTESRKGTKAGERKPSENDSEEELQPPSPIQIAPEGALVPDFDFPDPKELRRIESDTQNRLKAILEVAGVTGLSQIDARTFQDPEILRKLTNSVSTALDEAATALTRMKSEKQNYEAFLRGANQTPPPTSTPSSAPPTQPHQQGKVGVAPSSVVPRQEHPVALPPPHPQAPPTPQALPQGDNIQAVQRLLTQAGQGIHDATEDGESLLSLACSAGYYELAEVLLRMRASVEDRGVKGDSTPLMEAASGGYADIVKLLIDHGANVNAKSSVGNTALTYACCGGYEDVVRILLEAGADVEHQNENGHTPLMEAASCGHVGVAKLLLEFGANINTHSNEFKESALTLACYKGHLEMVKFLLSAGADQEHKTDEMHTALMEASMDGHVEVARLLLDHGAQVNMPVDSFESPLTLAACGGHYELAALLISRGADLEEVNDEGYTPLMEAAREGHEDVVQLLVEHGANVNGQTEETQETALTLACCGGFLEVAQYLIEHGADIELGASTPLMEAAQEGHVDIVKFLIERGANIHAETNTGDTALTYACANGHTIIADILLQCGAELEHESEGGRTPLMKAARAGHLQTVQFLVARGADVNRQTASNDHTVLSLACAGGHVSVVQYLLMQAADPMHMLRDSSTMLIEAARGGHTAVASLLLRQSRRLGTSTIQALQKSEQQSAEIRRYASSRKSSQSSTKIQQKQVNLQPNHVPTSEHQYHMQQGQPQSKGKEADSGSGGEVEAGMAVQGSTPPQSGAKRQKLLHEEGQQGAQVVPDLSTSTQQQFTAKHPQYGHMISPDVAAQYAADSSTALRNIQRLTASVGQTTSSSVPGPQGGSSVTPDDIMQGHVTAEDIINRYWMQRLVRQTNTSEGATVTANGTGTAQTELAQTASGGYEVTPDNAQKMFSSGNFSTDIPFPPHSTYPYAAPRFHASSSTGQVLGEQASVAAATASSLLQNPDISRLLPHLEAIAGSLQNPSSFESQYLAALAHTQLMPGLAASTATGGQALPNAEATQASSVDGKPPSSLPHSDSMEKFMDQIANMEVGPEVATDVHSQAVCSGEYPHQAKQHPQNTKAHSSSSDGYEGQNFDVDLLQHRPRSLSASFLLDSNFPLDIPPPSDLIPDHLSGMLPAGYVGSLENESYPTSEEEEEEEEEVEEEESDSSYLAQDLSALPPGVTFDPAIDIDQQTDSNHDTALSLAAAGGHDELVELLLAQGADIEHRDKKGCTPLILAASAGHAVMVAILLDHNADIEAQSDRTKDTALSLACSGGRQEVVELLLAKGANFEHRNVSDYTPLSLAASGGYVNIIKLLLRAGADINSRTGSKLGISPLMLAAMNGHTSTVKLLLDMGSDINAQIETNRNTALTLACFQGRHEVVNLLVERQANVEHRAKTGLTPLMEAASGGYHEVGKVLIYKGADVNAAPVPSSRDTALTIAADKGHYKFVELILRHGAHVDVKNKKGNSPLWLASNGGHLDVVRLLVDHGADVDSQDNRKVSCLMAAFRKGHYKVVKYLVDHVSQFPSDAELTRYINTLSDKELLKKCQRCMEVIIDAKERQAAEANKNASILLQEIDLERQHEEDRKAAAARKRAKKKRQKEKKQAIKAQIKADKERGTNGGTGDTSPEGDRTPDDGVTGGDDITENGEVFETTPTSGDGGRESDSKEDTGLDQVPGSRRERRESDRSDSSLKTTSSRHRSLKSSNQISPLSPLSRLGSPTATITLSPLGSVAVATLTTPTSSPRKGRKEEGWKEVGRRTKKISVPSSIFSQVVGKNSCHLAAIRHATSTQIEVDRHSRQSPTRTITIRGSAEAIKQAHHYLSVLIRDPSKDLSHILPKSASHGSVHSRSHVTSHEPPPLSTLDTFDEPSDAPPARGSTSAASVSVTVTTTSGVTLLAKATYKRAGPVGAVTTNVAVSAGSKSTTTTHTNPSSLKGGRAQFLQQQQQHPSLISLDQRLGHTSSVTATTTRVLATSVASTSHKLPGPLPPTPTSTSGAVRRLFVTPQSTTPATIVVTATQTVSYPPKVSATLAQSSSHSKPTTVISSTSVKHPGPVGKPPPSIAHVAPLRPLETSLKTSEPSAVIKPTAVKSATLPAMHTGGLSYSSIIGSQDGQLQVSNVIEQPLQQIMKTPTIFQEPPATQLTKLKKKSSYSDAVGKKLPTTEASSFKMAPLNPPVPSQPLPPPPSQPKLNLAPGSWPLVSDEGEKPIPSPSSSSFPHPSEKKRTSPWNDPEFRQSFDEEEKISPSATNLGPIGPPSKAFKQPQLPKVGPGFSPVSAHPRTSPTGVLVASPQRSEPSPATKSPLLGTAPPGLLPPPDKGLYSTAFHPIQLQPAEFTLGGESGSFQTLIPTPLRNSRPPLLATPPGFAHTFLPQDAPLTTAPGFLLPQGLHQSPLLTKGGKGPTSPSLSPDKISVSPNRSPPHPPVKGFNPNAPTFIPMGLQNMSRPANPPTSSILGPPPPTKFGFGPPSRNSLLGNVPQLPTSGVYGSARIVSPPIFSNQQPQTNSQSSLLGQPPTPPLNPQIFAPPNQQGFPPLSNRQNQPLYGQQQPLEGNAPGGLIQPPHFSIIPFPPPGQNLSVQPTQNLGPLKDAFLGSFEPPLLPTQPPPIIASTSGDMYQFGMSLTSDSNPDLAHGGAPGPMLLAVSAAGGRFDAPPQPQLSSNTLISQFGLNLGDLRTIASSMQHQDGLELDQKNMTEGFSKPPAMDSYQPFPPSYLQNSTTSHSTNLTSSTSYMMMAPNLFAGSEVSSTSTVGETSLSDSLPPIGTERAHKRAPSLSGSSTFPPVITPGINASNVWSYSGNPTSSEDSDWSKAAVAVSDSGDWPTLSSSSTGSDIINPGGDIIITAYDNLESVLQKLGLTAFHHLFQTNEIDLAALLLMSEKDFSEIGLPQGPRLKLLGAIGRHPSEGDSKEESVVAMTTGQASEGVASQRPDLEEVPALLPSNQQPETSQ